MQDARVSLNELLTLSAHPLVCVGREAGPVADLVLGRGIDDALARLSQEVIEIDAIAYVPEYSRGSG